MAENCFRQSGFPDNQSFYFLTPILLSYWPIIKAVLLSHLVLVQAWEMWSSSPRGGMSHVPKTTCPHGSSPKSHLSGPKAACHGCGQPSMPIGQSWGVALGQSGHKVFMAGTSQPIDRCDHWLLHNTLPPFEQLGVRPPGTRKHQS